MKFHPPNKLFTRAYRKFLHRPMKDVILLLTTTGRKTGRPHTIGLQYELIDGRYYLGAADGNRLDWDRKGCSRCYKVKRQKCSPQSCS